ncbi:hypothetical protein ABM34_07510 [Companilactobacillus ginsenosidimutans]|uniref:DUF4422 domain-containing protein n=2 Tax=Companilactobacillus ginsenosidimutans TaxID=1007676 RepID=A0A0H4QJ41_9LACO|nr:DUF4422 domain-containing protein [Companilactobacillus ginsenosidimutans]AKP68434.1 hypothetical protein ABM34_07510 [Companilactobacillus ginsenosidimutans]
MPDDDKLYHPILVGSYKNYQNGMSYLRDDAGINISKKNPNYNELTAIYWAWKNIQDADAIGLVHYRRFFGKDEDDLLNQDLIDEKLSKHDVILPTERKYYVETNYSHYVHAHHEEPLLLTRRIIEKHHNDYLSAFDQAMNKRSAHMFNMFVMKQNQFSTYCEWLFSILEKLEENIYVEEYSEQEARVFGYIAEILMDVWIDKNDINYCEHDWIQIGGEKKISKVVHFLLRKFGLSKKTHF